MRPSLPFRAAILAAGLAAGPVVAQDAGTARAPEEMFAQAERYHEGLGVLQNFGRAAELYRAAAEAGYAEAQNRLGQYLHTGLGLPADRAQAIVWLEKAAAQGDSQHVFDLAQVLEQGDPDAQARAATLYAQAAEAGHQEAMVSLGVMYQNGTGVTQDYARALDLYSGPAAAGNARAQNNLGLLYVRANGVAQDYQQAVSLFRAAAEQGLPIAMTNLSVMYANGFGIEQSDALAEFWARQASQVRQDAVSALAPGAPVCLFDPRLQEPATDGAGLDALSRGAEGGDPVALFLAGWLACSPPGTIAPDPRRAARLFRAAAERGYGPAMLNLARLYIRGYGVPQDFVLGYMWLTLAGSAGIPTSHAEDLLGRMTPAQVNEAQERAAVIWQQMPPL